MLSGRCADKRRGPLSQYSSLVSRRPTIAMTNFVSSCRLHLGYASDVYETHRTRAKRTAEVSATGRHILRRHRASADLLYLCKRHHFDDGGRVRMVEPCWRQVRRYGAHQIPDPQACVIARLGPRGRPAQRTGRNCRSVHSDERACR